MTITPEEIEREKKTLPFGWGRYGKAYDQLAGISEPDESLLAAGVALRPEYHQGGRFVPGTLASAVSDLRKTTNVLVACTNRRLIMISTGVAGGVGEHVSIPYEGMGSSSARGGISLSLCRRAESRFGAWPSRSNRVC